MSGLVVMTVVCALVWLASVGADRWELKWVGRMLEGGAVSWRGRR